MSPIESRSNHHGAWRAVLLTLWTAAAAASAFAPAVAGGVLLVLLGALTPLLPVAAAGRAALRSRDLWHRVAGVAWVTGAMVGIVMFGRALGESDHIEAIATGMALAFVPGVIALVLASLIVAAAARWTPLSDASVADTVPAAWDSGLRRGLLLALVVWFTWAPRPGARELPFQPRDWLLHGPALLVAAGAALAFALLAGPAWKRLVPALLAAAGTVAALAGLVQALLGMARVSIAQVTAGLESVTTACYVALVALALLACAPDTREDGDGSRTTAQLVYAVFPLVSLLLLAITVVMVLTPMTKPL